MSLRGLPAGRQERDPSTEFIPSEVEGLRAGSAIPLGFCNSVGIARPTSPASELAGGRATLPDVTSGSLAMTLRHRNKMKSDCSDIRVTDTNC